MNKVDAIPPEELEAFCRRWHLTELSFFGSVLRDDFTANSDIDAIVDFESGHVPGFAFAQLCRELEEIVGHPVDVLTRMGLESSKESRVRRRIAETAQVYYGRSR